MNEQTQENRMERRRTCGTPFCQIRMASGYMVNDYAKGCSLMEYIKQGIPVEKETVFEWIRQLSNSGTVLSLWK